MIRNDDSATQLCNCIVSNGYNDCSNIAALCCAKNRRSQSSRVTSPLSPVYSAENFWHGSGENGTGP